MPNTVEIDIWYRAEDGTPRRRAYTLPKTCNRIIVDLAAYDRELTINGWTDTDNDSKCDDAKLVNDEILILMG